MLVTKLERERKATLLTVFKLSHHTMCSAGTYPSAVLAATYHRLSQTWKPSKTCKYRALWSVLLILHWIFNKGEQVTYLSTFLQGSVTEQLDRLNSWLPFATIFTHSSVSLRTCEFFTDPWYVSKIWVAWTLSLVCFRDLTSNQLNGTIPSGLLKRIQDGSLSLRSLPCSSNTSF